MQAITKFYFLIALVLLTFNNTIASPKKSRIPSTQKVKRISRVQLVKRPPAPRPSLGMMESLKHIDIKLYTKNEFKENLLRWTELQKNHTFTKTGLQIVEKSSTNEKCKVLKKIRYYAQNIHNAYNKPIKLYITVICSNFQETSLLQYKLSANFNLVSAELFAENLYRDHLLIRFMEAFMLYHYDLFSADKIMAVLLKYLLLNNLPHIYVFIKAFANSHYMFNLIKAYNTRAKLFAVHEFQKNFIQNIWFYKILYLMVKKPKVIKSIDSNILKLKNPKNIIKSYINVLIYIVGHLNACTINHFGGTYIFVNVQEVIQELQTGENKIFMNKLITSLVMNYVSDNQLPPIKITKSYSKIKTIYLQKRNSHTRILAELDKVRNQKRKQKSKTNVKIVKVTIFHVLIYTVIILLILFLLYGRIEQFQAYRKKQYKIKQKNDLICKKENSLISILKEIQQVKIFIATIIVENDGLSLSVKQQNVLDMILSLNFVEFIKNKQNLIYNNKHIGFSNMLYEAKKLELYLNDKLKEKENNNYKSLTIQSSNENPSQNSALRYKQQEQVEQLKADIQTATLNKDYRKDFDKCIELLESSYRRPVKIIQQLELLLLIVNGLATLKSYKAFLVQILEPYKILKQKNKIKLFEQKVAILKQELSEQNLI